MRKGSSLTLALLMIGSLAFGQASTEPSDRIREQIREMTAGHELEKTTLHPDGTREERYLDPDGGVIRVVYRPDGRVDTFGAPAYEPSVELPPQLEPLGYELEAETSLEEAARDAYDTAASYIAPKTPIEIEIEVGVALSSKEIEETPLPEVFTLFPRRVLSITPGTMHFSGNRTGYLGSRTAIEGRWAERSDQNPAPEIETLNDFLSALRTLGHQITEYEVIEVVPLTISATFEEQTVSYKALALRLATENGQRLLFFDKVLGHLVDEGQRQSAPPYAPEDYRKFPGSEHLFRDLGVPEPTEEVGRVPIEHWEPQTDDPDRCCEVGTRILRFTEIPEYDQTAHDGSNGVHRAQVKFKLYCSCEVECHQIATTTVDRHDGTFCEELGFTGVMEHVMRDDDDGMTVNAWNAVTASSAARADVGYICGMRQCPFGACVTSFRLGVTAPPLNGAVTFDLGNTLWRYKRGGGLACPPCERHTDSTLGV